MPTIIECPACATRYKMNKAVPEGGRYVKCARCGHQWRLVPEGSAEFEDDTIEEHGNSMTSQHTAPGGAAAQHPVQDDDGYDGYEGGESVGADDDWRNSHEEHAADPISAGSGELAGHDWNEGQDDDGDGDRAALKNAWTDYENKLQAEQGPEATNGLGDEDGWAERVKRSAWGQDEAGAQAHEEPQAAAPSVIGASAGLHDPEMAIREALNTALHHTPAEAPAASSGAADPFQDFWQGFASGEEDEEGRALDARRADAIAAQIENVRRSSVLYDPSALRDGYTGEDDADAATDPAIQDSITAAFKQDAAPKRPPTRPEYRHDASLTDYDAVTDDHAAVGEEALDGEYDAEYMNGDTAALQAELENFGHMPYDEPRRGGGLALVAAWAVFLSIVSGIALAFVNFRDNIMTALPGTTRLYSAIGFDIADRSVDFGNVGYRWTEAGGKPVLEIKGQIVNTTDHEVDVPRVLITMHDGQDADGVKTVETVRSEPLGARETVPFTWEISASQAVKQVELEFDNSSK